MKKLSLLISLILCVTIGGVYAAWTYAGSNDITDAHHEIQIIIPAPVIEGSNGAYSIETNIANIIVDDTNGDHKAELVFKSKDDNPIYIKIIFTPDTTRAPQNIIDNGLNTEFYFTTTTAMTYNIDAAGNYSETGTPTPILTFSNPSNGTFEANIGALNSDVATKWTQEDNGTFTYTLEKATIEASISLTQPFFLDTREEYDAFKSALNGAINFNVTDGIINGKVES